MAIRRGAGALLSGLSLLAAGPALAADYALFAPGSPAKEAATATASSAAAAAVIERARLALKRPPAPLATVHIEATLPGQGTLEASRKALEDLPVARDLALSWRLTGDRAYLRQAERYLVAWADTYKPSFNPIDESGFGDLIAAYDLTEADLAPASRRKVDALLRRFATGYLEAMETGKVERPQTLTNNWQSHRVKLATLSAFQLGDQALIDRARTAYQKQVAANLRPDGAPLDFAMRDALHYVVFTLEPLSTAAYAAKANGQDWYGYTLPQGASLAKSLDWLATYARGEKTHVEFANSVVPFDRQRREAGVAGFQNANWKPAEAAEVYALASLFEPRYAALRDQLRALPEAPVADHWVLLAGAAPAATAASSGGASPRPPIAIMGTALRSTHLARSSRFYTEGLGLTVAGNLQTEMYDEVIFGVGGSRNPPLILLLKFRSGKAPPARTVEGAPEKIILTVADADALAARLKASGYAPSAVQTNVAAKVKQFFVSDPDGNRFEITERQGGR